MHDDRHEEVVKLPLARFLSRRPFPYLGRISFGIYVFHIVAISLFEIHGNRPIPAFHRTILVSLAFMATILAAVASYELFEKRFLRLKKRFTCTGSFQVPI